jgi:hypothetical protein
MIFFVDKYFISQHNPEHVRIDSQVVVATLYIVLFIYFSIFFKSQAKSGFFFFFFFFVKKKKNHIILKVNLRF